MNVLLVQVTPEIEAVLRDGTGREATIRTAAGPDEVLTELNRPDAAPVLLVLGTGMNEPVRLAQRVRTVNPRIGIMVLADPEQHEALCRAVTMSPFLASSVLCLSVDDPDGIAQAFQQELRRASRQQAYRAMVDAVQSQLTSSPAPPPSSAAYLDRLLEHAPVGVVLMDEDGHIQAWNRQAGLIFGRTEREAIGERLTDLFPDYERKRLASYVGHRLNGRAAALSETFERTAPDGDAQYVDVTATDVSERGTGRAAMVILQDITGRVRAEEEARRMSQQAAVNAALARQAAELKQLNDELEARNRDLQEFAYVASHDLQEPLRKISSFADLLNADYGDRLDATGHHYLERMQSAAVRMSRLITDLLTFSRVRTRGEPFEPVDLDRVLKDVLSDLDVAIRESDARVQAEPLPTVEADASQMHQLFQNLISNGLKFRAPDRPPHVRLTAAIEPHRDRPYCRIEVSDNGIGFDEKYLSRIFLPFQRLHTKDAYPGTGIGLAICRRIVERHGGTLTARSTPGEGATFIVTLPVADARTGSEIG